MNYDSSSEKRAPDASQTGSSWAEKLPPPPEYASAVGQQPAYSLQNQPMQTQQQYQQMQPYVLQNPEPGQQPSVIYVATQPEGTAMQNEVPVEPEKFKTEMVTAIISCFFCLPFGAIAVLLAYIAKSKAKAGDYIEARTYGKASLRVASGAIGVGVALIISLIIIMVYRHK